MSIKVKSMLLITMLFVGCAAILYFFDTKIAAGSGSDAQLSFPIFSLILLLFLMFTLLIMTHLHFKQFDRLIQEYKESLKLKINELKDSQNGLEEMVEKRTFEISVINASLNREIAERIQAETESNKLKDRFQLILDSAGEGIFGLDNEGNVTFINNSATLMLGWDMEDLIGKSHHALVHHTHKDGSPHPVEECPIHMAYRDGLVHARSDDVFWAKNGKSFPVEYFSTPIKENNKIVGAVVVFRDPTLFK